MSTDRYQIGVRDYIDYHRDGYLAVWGLVPEGETPTCPTRRRNSARPCGAQSPGDRPGPAFGPHDVRHAHVDREGCHGISMIFEGFNQEGISGSVPLVAPIRFGKSDCRAAYGPKRFRAL